MQCLQLHCYDQLVKLDWIDTQVIWHIFSYGALGQVQLFCLPLF